MADKCVQMFTEGPYLYYLWDSGWLVGFNTDTERWEKRRVKHPSEISEPTLDLELAPEVSVDD